MAISQISNAGIASGAVAQSNLATSVAGTGPAFRVYPSTSQTVNHGVYTKINWGSESYDTAGAFSSSTFTAPISGYYQLSAVLNLDVTNSRSYYMLAYIYKNGSGYSYTENGIIANASGRTAVAVSDLLYLAATDYIDIYLYSYDYTATTTVSVRTSSYFNGCLVRAA